jgi:hypothetical protein
VRNSHTINPIKITNAHTLAVTEPIQIEDGDELVVSLVFWFSGGIGGGGIVGGICGGGGGGGGGGGEMKEEEKVLMLMLLLMLRLLMMVFGMVMVVRVVRVVSVVGLIGEEVVVCDKDTEDKDTAEEEGAGAVDFDSKKVCCQPGEGMCRVDAAIVSRVQLTSPGCWFSAMMASQMRGDASSIMAASADAAEVSELGVRKSMGLLKKDEDW